MRNLVVLWVALCWGTSSMGAPSDACHYQDIASSYRSEYIWYQILENLEKSLDAGFSSAPAFKIKISEAMASTQSGCGQPDEIYYDLESLKDVNIQGNRVAFSLFGKDHHLEVKRNKNSRAFIYRRANRRGYSTVHFQLNRNLMGEVLNIRALGHAADSESALVRYFFYDSQNKLVSRSPHVPLNYGNGELKSLQMIYGADFNKKIVKQPKVRVGVIGTGIDYNHPKLAKHLQTRIAFEDQLQAIEENERLVAEQSYDENTELPTQLSQLEENRESVGFPIWMDQAWKTPRPYDRLIPAIQGRGSQHETAMAGRILQSGGSIGIYSVRKAYMRMANENLIEIFENFHKAGVQVVNLSYSYPCGKSDAFESQWRQVFAAYPEIFVVAAAGNDGKNSAVVPYCPARYSQDYKNVISVTALNTDHDLAVYNDLSVNFGTAIDLAAVADNLETYKPNGRQPMVKKNGASSMATAEVSRILVEALLKDLPLESAFLKSTLKKASVPSANLLGRVGSGGVINQKLFEAELLKIAGKSAYAN